MAETTITALDTASGIDATQDWLAIDRTSLVATQKINRNTFLGITSTPLGTTDSQSPTNKTFDNTNIFTLRDDRFTLQDNSDTTKQAQFQLSGITTATTRTYTLPNASGTLADLSTAQAFTNKTLTSPVITGGTISNSTISVDAIAEFTAANGVTVDGMNIKDGKLNTNNSVVTSNITDAAVTPAKLIAGTGSSWAWQSWTPTWTNLTVTSSTVTARYIQIGKTVFFRICVVLGGGNVPSGNVSFTLPVTSASYAGTSTLPHLGTATYYITNGYPGSVVWTNTTTASFRVENVGSTYPTDATISATIPNTFVNGSEIIGQGFYEAA